MSRPRPYIMRPGSCAAMVVEHLEGAGEGARLSRNEIAQKFGAVQANVTTLLAKACDNGLLAFTSDGRERYYHLPAGVAEDDGKLTMAHYSDGDLDVSGMQIEGSSARFTRDQLQQLVDYVTQPRIRVVAAGGTQ